MRGRPQGDTRGSGFLAVGAGRTGYACAVCGLPAPAAPFQVRYEAGDNPPFPGELTWLCDPHSEALGRSALRPVVRVLDTEVVVGPPAGALADEAEGWRVPPSAIGDADEAERDRA